MRSLNYTKLISIIAFVSLAGFSCFWTAESLYIWFPNLTLFGSWLVAVVFYIVASICFTLLLKSLDRQVSFYGRLGGRNGAMLLGFFGLLIFWLCVSLPTNTHTLLYRGSIKNVLENDLARTQGYLDELKHNNTAIEKVNLKYSIKEKKVNSIIDRMRYEVVRPSAEGIGPRFNSLVIELNAALSEDTGIKVNIQEQPTQNTESGWVKVIEYYQSQAYSQLQLYRKACDEDIKKIQAAMDSKKLEDYMTDTEKALKNVKNMNGINDRVIDDAVKVLNTDYGYIKAHSQYITFKDKDKELYTRPVPVAEAQVMRSVPEVWKDYFTERKYSFDNGFIWWVLIALLVDISAFVFFNIAFK